MPMWMTGTYYDNVYRNRDAFPGRYFFLEKRANRCPEILFGSMRRRQDAKSYTIYRNTVQRVRAMRSAGVEIIGFLCSKKDKKLCINPLQYPAIYYILKKLV